MKYLYIILLLITSGVKGNDLLIEKGRSMGEIAVKTITIRTTSKSSAWSPKEIINTGATLLWTVSGGVTIGEKKTNNPTFDLRQNSGTAIITIESSTNFAGLKRIRVQNLVVSDVNINGAQDLFVFRGDGNKLKTFKATPSMLDVQLNSNLLTSSVLDGIVNDLDSYGLKNGALEIQDNAGALSGSSYNAYQNLKNKGWTIDVPSPSGTDPGPSDPGSSNSLTIRTTSKSSSWSPKEIINTGSTLTWNVSGGVSIGDKKINHPTFNLSKNTGTAIITIESSTNFAGLKRVRIQNLAVSDVNLTGAKDLVLFRGDGNKLKTFKATPSMYNVRLNSNLLTSSALDGIVNDLDSYGLKNGVLEIQDNAGALSGSSYNAYQNLKNKGWTINVPSPSNSSGGSEEPEEPSEPEDINPPNDNGGPSSGLSDFRILASQPNRVYFDSSKKITASNTTGFIISGNTISGVRINSGKTTGHYFTVKSSFNFWDNSLIRYIGGSNFKDTEGIG